MVSEKEILIQAVEQYACKAMNQLFHISSLPAQTLVRYGVRNLADKYSNLLDVFVDKSGSINVELLFDAFKSEVRSRGGLDIMGIRFGESDFDEIKNNFDKLMSNNV